MNAPEITSMTRFLAWGLAWCLAGSNLHAAKEAGVNPFAGKTLSELKEVVLSGDAEIERILAAQAINDLLKPSPDPGKGGRNRGRKGPKGGEPDESGPAITPGDRRLALEAAAAGIADSSCAVRHYSRKSLTALGTDAVPVLMRALAAGDIFARQAAALAVYDMGGRGGRNASLPVGVEVLVPPLIEGLGDESYVVREAAAFACRGLGTVAAPALSQLVALLRDDEFSVANAAVHAVAAADPTGRVSVPALVGALDGRHDLREFICVELGAMGQNAAAAVPALVKLVDADRNNWHAGNAACEALMSIVAFHPRDQEGNTVEDRTAKVRPMAIAAIVRSSLDHDTHFCRWDRHRALFLKPGMHCPFGDEIAPLVPKVEADLREYMAMDQTKFWPPRQETCDLAVRVGRSSEPRRKAMVALVKELLSAETTIEAGRKQLERMMETLEQ